jgi:hypothetical protein
MVHSQALARTAPGSPPGFDGGALTYPVSTDAPMPDMWGTQVPVSTQPGEDGGKGLPPRKPSGTPDGGQWAQTVTGPGPESGWAKTPSAS